MEASESFFSIESSFWVFHHKKPHIHLLLSCPLGRAWGRRWKQRLRLQHFTDDFYNEHVCVCVNVPSLVEVNEKHDIISETCQSVRRWHGDDKGKHIVDEGVECLEMIN